MAGDDDILDSSDGLTDAERAQFNEMQSATSGDQPIVDAGATDAGANAGAAAEPSADAAAAAAAAEANKAIDAGKAAAAPAAGKEGTAPDAAAAAAAEDDDDEIERGADGKPVQGADGKPKKRRVSANKYNAEKTRADKLAADLSARDQLLARADERMRLITEALTAPKAGTKEGEAAEDAKPDPEQDAFGYMKWSDAKIAKLEQAITEMREGKQTEDGQRVMADAYMQDAQSYASREPNFAPAYTHLMNSRSQELAMYFFGVDLTEEGAAAKLTPQQWGRIKSTAAEEERGIVENAISQGRSPAQAVYQMARYRGYVPQKPAAANSANGAAAHAGNGANGKAAANGLAAESGGKGANVSDEIARIKAGTEAALSLSDGGASPANPLTAQKLADMPDAQFQELMDRLDGNDPDAFRRLMEGTA